ncbi:protein of unknown function [Candidatus Nitrospira inopinata]|uniref:Uncharacterized protein n=1 Tax=Candidatus Nitrospira inopinata TaxID=1715989 RepID=A0A0S4KWT9_9BACT|nr:protein of unknown function [Candidatus Nitrospira inopinata]
MSPNMNGPWHPIIYVRGYAMTQGEIDRTTADPFCGFNPLRFIVSEWNTQ